MAEPVVLIAEPLLHPQFIQAKQTDQLATALSRKFDVTVVAPSISERTQGHLGAKGIDSRSAFPVYPTSPNGHFEVASYVLSWGMEAIPGLNRVLVSRALRGLRGVRLNLSMTTTCQSDIWWVQGRPVGPTLASIKSSLSPALRFTATFGGPALSALDWFHMRRKVRRSRRILTNSTFLAHWYGRHGYRVDGVIPSFGFQPKDFYPSTPNPRRDYILVYVGKETDSATLAQLVAEGLPVHLFGAKSRSWLGASFLKDLPSTVTIHGHLSTEELRELYTHAMFTAFPYTEEPFGLVPVESMACGTPVLTYATQGPVDTVFHGVTGWLAGRGDEFVSAARSLYSAGLSPDFARNCTAWATQYSFDSVARMWIDTVRASLDQTPVKAFPQNKVRTRLLHAMVSAEAGTFLEPFHPVSRQVTTTMIHRRPESARPAVTWAQGTLRLASARPPHPLVPSQTIPILKLARKKLG
jgi:hypothetical protein